MNQIIVTVEKTKNGYIAFNNNQLHMEVCAPSIDLLKCEVNVAVAKLYFKLSKKYPSQKLGRLVYPKIKYKYNVAKLLVEVQPYMKHKALADQAGLTSVSLSYYLKDKRVPSEKTFNRIIQAIKDISLMLVDLSYG